MKGFLITFEGTEGSGKSTQIRLLEKRLVSLNFSVQVVREPGGTPIGEEIRHTLKHSAQNADMTPETELLLVNASRAQLVRQIIRPALDRGEFVLCDRYYDSTVAYQGYGRGLDLPVAQSIIDFAVGPTRPDLTFFLHLAQELSAERVQKRNVAGNSLRDRMEEADREFFSRVECGYIEIARKDPARVKRIDAGRSVSEVEQLIWEKVQLLLDSALADRKRRTGG